MGNETADLLAKQGATQRQTRVPIHYEKAQRISARQIQEGFNAMFTAADPESLLTQLLAYFGSPKNDAGDFLPRPQAITIWRLRFCRFNTREWLARCERIPSGICRACGQETETCVSLAY